MDDEIETVVWDPDSVSSDLSWQIAEDQIIAGKHGWDVHHCRSCDEGPHFNMPPKKVVHYRIVPIDGCPKVVGEWTKVEDGLPKEDQRVWAYGHTEWDKPGKGYRVTPCDYRFPSEFFKKTEPYWLAECAEIVDVTHWMPYVEPEPPDDSV